MIVLHVENDPLVCGSLATQLGVKNGQLGRYRYIATDAVAGAEKHLRSGEVKALILDLGLDIPQDNDQAEMDAAIRSIAGLPGGAGAGARKLEAHKLALVAHRHKQVPCILLTNWLEQLRLDSEPVVTPIRKAFHAAAIFRKDGPGMRAAVTWLRQTLSL